jgi:hypothetical protein
LIAFSPTLLIPRGRSPGQKASDANPLCPAGARTPKNLPRFLGSGSKGFLSQGKSYPHFLRLLKGFFLGMISAIISLIAYQRYVYPHQG